MSQDAKKAPRRRANGQFDEGSSGNYRGRPIKQRRIPHPEEIRDMVYELGLYGVPINLDGASYEVPLIVANLLTIGTKGARGDLRAAKNFFEAWQKTAEQEAKHIEELTRRFDGVWPAYMTERDPAERAELKRAWDELAKEMAGMRNRRSEPFPPRKRRRRPKPS